MLRRSKLILQADMCEGSALMIENADPFNRQLSMPLHDDMVSADEPACVSEPDKYACGQLFVWLQPITVGSGMFAGTHAFGSWHTGYK